MKTTLARSFRVLTLCFACSAVLGGCGYIAVQTAPAKHASTSRSDAAVKADAAFWETLHSAQYEEIPRVLQALTSAYLANPNDAVTAAHIGWMQANVTVFNAPVPGQDKIRQRVMIASPFACMACHQQ